MINNFAIGSKIKMYLLVVVYASYEATRSYDQGGLSFACVIK